MRKTGGDLGRIDSLAELQAMGVVVKRSGDGEVLLLCPNHDDHEPSLSLNTGSNLFRCPVCKFSGNVFSLIAKIRGTAPRLVYEELADRYGLGKTRSIRPSTYEAFHQALVNGTDVPAALRVALTRRGLDEKDIREHRIGYAEGRLTIPVMDQNGRCINIRRYLPGAPGPQKMRNTPGMTPTALFKVDQVLRYDTLWVCGGELKAIVAARKLNPMEVGACSPTGAEGTWLDAWGPMFKGKTVFVCMDIDEPGKRAARAVALALSRVAAEVFVVNLPLDPIRFPKGDVNDWVASGASGTDFRQVMEEAERFEIKPQVDIAAPATKIHVSHVTDPAHTNKVVSFEGVVSAIGRSAYAVPTEITVQCPRNQPNCHVCPVSHAAESATGDPQDFGVPLVINPRSREVLEMMQLPDKWMRSVVGRATRIVDGCRVWDYRVTKHGRVLPVQVGPTIEDENSDLGTSYDYRQFEAVTVGEPELGEPMRFTGIPYSHPRDQRQVVLLDSFEPVEDTLSQHDPKPEELQELTFHRPTEWTVDAIRDRLRRRYEDLASNVTAIVNRPDLHTAVDMTYHSPLQFKLRGRTFPGWVNSLIVGDTEVGKSTATERLIQHYKLGVRAVAKRASVAGLIGGLQQFNNRWMVTWGVVPRHSKRLVVIDELKGLAIDEIAQLTDMRSSGVAQLVKVEEAKAPARTRLICISNPRTRGLHAYLNPIECVSELVGAEEDVRRFDFVLLMVKDDQISLDRPEIEHGHTSHLCRNLILWAWSRSPAQVLFTEGADDALHKSLQSLHDRFGLADIPLLSREMLAEKVARLAASAAALTFSTSDDMRSVVVRRCHCEFVVRWLERIYRGSGLTELRRRRDQECAVNVDGLRSFFEGYSASGIVIAVLGSHGRITAQVLQSFGLPYDEAGAVFRKLVSTRAVIVDGRGARVNPSLLPHLSTLERSGDKPQRDEF